MPENKKCWACQRTLVGDAKLGLCTDCTNKYGSRVATVLVLGAGIGVRKIVKNGDKIIEFASKVVRH